MASSYPIKNKNGVVYAYRVRVYRGRDVDGKQLKPYSTVWKIPDGMKNSRTIKKELDRFSVLFEQQCKEGMVSTDRKTFAAYSEYYLALKERDQKQKTVDSYRDLLVRINEEIGFLKLSDVNCEHLNRFYIKLAQKGQNKKTGEGLSPKTIVEHHRLIHSIFAQAMKEGLVKFNPAETASPPSVKKKEASFFEAEDVERIMKCLEQEPLKWRCITLLMIATGARRGEIMGLKWSAIDFKKDEIKICANLLYSKQRGIYEDTPKTGEIRYVCVDHSVMKLLAQYRKEQTIMRLRMGERWVNTGYCFTRENGEPIHPDSITSWLNKFSKKYGLPHINPHKFRHTQASILINEGVDVVTVAKRLGHKQVTTTENIYAHALAKADAEADAQSQIGSEDRTMNSFAPEVKGQAKAFASLLARSVREFFQDEQHRKEFEEWYLKKYDKSYVWEPVRWKR